jgi:hypothetical protein
MIEKQSERGLRLSAKIQGRRRHRAQKEGTSDLTAGRLLSKS